MNLVDEMTKPSKHTLLRGNKWQLMVYDGIIFIAVVWLLLVMYSGDYPLTWQVRLFHTSLAFVTIFGARLAGGIYKQIWRYGGIQCYIRLLVTDGIAFLLDGNLDERGLAVANPMFEGILH